VPVEACRQQGGAGHDVGRFAQLQEGHLDDRQPGQPAALQFSNFSLLEDRVTHALELHLTTYGQDPKSVYTADNYKYTLTLKR